MAKQSKAKPKTNETLCDADKSRGRGKCEQPAGYGTEHLGFGRCKYYGGNAPSGKVTAAREQAESIRRTLIGTGYSADDVDPGTILLEELARTMAVVRWYEEMIAGDEAAQDDMESMGLEPGRAGGYAMGSAVIDIETTQGGIKYTPNIYVRQWMVERKHLAQVAKDCLAVGLKEREVRLAEQQGELLHRILTAVFTDDSLGLTAEQRVRAPALARKHLSLVGGMKEAS